MSSEIQFQEVVSNSAAEGEPLGTLAGRGINVGKKGGDITVKVSEPCNLSMQVAYLRYTLLILHSHKQVALRMEY